MVEDRNGRHLYKSSFSSYGRQHFAPNHPYSSSNFQPLLTAPLRSKVRHSRLNEPLLQPPMFNKIAPLRRRPQPPSSNGSNGFMVHDQQRLLPSLPQLSSSFSNSSTQSYHQSSFTGGESSQQPPQLPQPSQLHFLFNGGATNSMSQLQLQQLQNQQLLMNNSLTIVGSETLNQSNSSSSSLNNSCSNSNNPGDIEGFNKEDRRQSAPKQNVIYHEQRYKTELCRAYEEQKNCVYGDRCMFAHGHWELKKNVHRHPKYKTQKCVAFEKQGLCQFGPRCAFLHDKPFTLEQVLDQVQKLKRVPMPENPLPTVPSSAQSLHPTTQPNHSLLSCETFGVPLLCGGGKVMDKNDLLPDLSSLLLDEQANTAAILFSESSVSSRRLPVFEQLCSSSDFDYDLLLLDGSSLSTIPGSSWLGNSSFSNLGSTIISTSLSSNNSSLDASINSMSIA